MFWQLLLLSHRLFHVGMLNAHLICPGLILIHISVMEVHKWLPRLCHLTPPYTALPSESMSFNGVPIQVQRRALKIGESDSHLCSNATGERQALGDDTMYTAARQIIAVLLCLSDPGASCVLPTCTWHPGAVEARPSAR
eukprot:108613-Chlamydomonas_euryale.AAC.9